MTDAKEFSYEDYIKFVKERAKRTNYNAAEKLQRIDALGDMIFAARADYRKKQK